MASVHSKSIISSEYFQHRPLADPTSSIRLLEILPKRSADGLLQCQIFHSINADEYTSLSYVWGENHDRGGPFLILVDGKPLTVRYNLHSFLRVARSKFPKRKFWIDALCIDQENTVEKNHQVQQMGMIYAKAKEVIAWLGDEKTVEEAIDVILFLTRFRNLPWWFLDAIILVLSKRRNQKRKKRLGDFQDTFNKYWSRAWITQEIALAGRVRILARKKEWNMSTLSIHHARQIVGVFEREFESEFESNRPIRFFQFWSMVHRGHKAKLPLLELLSQYRNKQCSIERDRIFSLLSMCEEGPNLEVDYKCSEKRLLCKVLEVSMLSLCICSAEIALQGINIGAISRKDLSDEYFVSVTVDPTHIIPWNPSNYWETRQCTICQVDMDRSWNFENGLLFCLSSACHEIRGHLFWEQQSPSQGSFHCLGHSSTASISLGRKGDWVDVNTDACNKLYTIDFTLSALLKLFQGKGILPHPRLCGIACSAGQQSSRVKFHWLQR